MSRRWRIVTVMVVVLSTFGLCLWAGGRAETGSKQLKFVFICKKLNDDWFRIEHAAMQKKAEELGVIYNGIDCDYKDELCMQAVDNVIAQKVDGVVICVTNQGMGPAIVKKFDAAGIPVVAIDDAIADSSGKQIPYIGIPSYDSGIKTAVAMAKAANERGFLNSKNTWRIFVLDIAQVSTCHDMAIGYQDQFLKDIPGLKQEDLIFVDTKDGSFDNTVATFSAAFNAHPEVTHPILAGTDDYIAFAAVKVLEENGFDFKRALVSGWGAYTPSKDIFLMGGDIAKSYMSLALDPHKEGTLAIQYLYDKVVNGKPMPEETLLAGEIIDISNWKQQFPDAQ